VEANPCEALCGAGLRPLNGGFYSDEKLIPFDVIACRGWSAAGEGLVQQFEVDGIVGLHEEPGGKRTADGATGLISRQLD